MKVSVIVAAYNEAENIGDVLKVLKKATESKIVDEVLIVDDGSSDNTAEVARESELKVVSHNKNKGKAAAILTGIQNTTGEIILLLDADLHNLDLQHLKKLINPVKQNAKVMTIGKFSGSGFFSVTGNIFAAISGQRAFRRELAKAFHDFQESRFGVDFLITQTAKKNQYKIKIVKLDGASQRYAEQKLGFVKGFAKRLKMYYEIIKVIWR